MNYERLVELKRWKGVGFGFSVIGGSDTHIPPMICALVRDSPALLSKQVRFFSHNSGHFGSFNVYHEIFTEKIVYISKSTIFLIFSLDAAFFSCNNIAF